MRTRPYTYIIIGLLSIATMICTIGCENESDNGGVKFNNHSSQDVSVFVSSIPGVYSSTPEFILDPGEGERFSYSFQEIVYYTWEPQDTVKANQVSDTEVIFEDR